MIRTTSIRIWERENRLGPPGDHKLPIADPGWGPNPEEERQNMRDYKSLIVRGIRESVPRGNNTKLAFDGSQEKDETPATWLNRLERNFQLYSNIDSDSPEGQVIIKLQFVTKSWPDIQRKLEKMEDWQEKSINELLKEALRVYLRREEEKARAKARIMVAVARESTGAAENQRNSSLKSREGGPRPSFKRAESPIVPPWPFETREDYWEAPNHLFWICGDTAYTKLPGDWSGSCTIGIIKPAFFVLSKRLGAHLGVPVYDNLGKVERKKRDTLTIGGDQNGKGKIWTPEEIIKTYGPATWAQDGSWGYRTPIYMLNRIIRLQAVLEMVSNRTALALDHISEQLTQTKAVIYQIRLAGDYLLADEGGTCGKFNSSECCLEIDDKSAVIKKHLKRNQKASLCGKSRVDSFNGHQLVE
ncbi:hypothetical protein DUI87_30616 [Hirundo rustica rustica]|uniref:Core shell protein Gag P30 domain-containing protein n=1 Tax=Hirundo rustica rustica TaxID=333673 RepID=A0A3M0IWY0_HIRRU|nr:hypothetical protein DUI87_30616 [Hirundo rustica rustica]